MDLRLFSIEHAPKSLPMWDTILDDLGQPPPLRIARTLGVGTSTVYRWHHDGAPKIACLALFWLTRWGRSAVDTRATNDAITAAQLVRSLSEERSDLQSRVYLLTEERDHLSSIVRRFSELIDQRGRSSAAIADHSHKGMAPADSSVHAWPELIPLVGTAAEAEAAALKWPPLASLASAGPDSREVRQPATRSAKSREPQRTGQRQPSKPGESVQLSPLVSPWGQSATIVASDLEIKESPCALLELRQGHGAARLPAAHAAPVASPQAGPLPGAACTLEGVAGHGARPGPSSSATAPATTCTTAQRALPLAVETDEASAAPGLLSGAPAPAPAWSVFGQITATLQTSPPTKGST